MIVHSSALYDALGDAPLSETATAVSNDLFRPVPLESGPITLAKNRSPRWPDLFIVGAQNSATSSAYRFGREGVA
jgi:hypothetical protein